MDILIVLGAGQRSSCILSRLSSTDVTKESGMYTKTNTVTYFKNPHNYYFMFDYFKTRNTPVILEVVGHPFR